MTDRPILFSAPMVRALLEGRKTQTRRILPPAAQSRYRETPAGVDVDCGFMGWQPAETVLSEARWVSAKGALPPYAPGDRLWVREAFSYADHLPETVWYWADGKVAAFDCCRPKPSIHMPRWASRLTLVVTDVRVQRLQDISRDDCIAEGAPPPDGAYSMRDSFRMLWEGINGAGSWDANPWVAAISFVVHRANIDALPREGAAA